MRKLFVCDVDQVGPCPDSPVLRMLHNWGVSDNPTNEANASTTGSETKSEQQSTIKQRSVGACVRHSIAFVLLAVLAVGALWLYKDCTVTVSAGVTTKVCAPPSVKSAGVLLGILLVLTLLWPDLAEITVLGVSLKRKVAEAVNQATAAESKAVQVENALQLQQLRIDSVVSSTSVASASSNNHFHFPRGEWSQQESDRLKKYQDDFVPERSPEDGGIDSNPFQDYSDNDLAMRLLREFEGLSKLLNIGPYRPNGRGRGYRDDPQSANEIRWFVEERSAVLNNVRRLRNSIAHGESFSRQDVIAGLDVVESLVGEANDLLHKLG